MRGLTAGLCLIGLAGDGRATEPLKVICASRAVQAPVIDGVLDEPCWQATEVRSDFTCPSLGTPVQRLTAMRCVYDNQALYLGLEFHWDDVERLRQGIAAILSQAGPPPPGVLDFRKYVNRYGVELFIDPEATEVNYYQILLNAAGQYTGNFKMLWQHFKGGQTWKATIRDSTWTVEFAYPHKGLRAGDQWGLNVCRNDEDYYAIWKQVGGAYHAPKLFGRIVMGSYAEWWQAAWGGDVRTRLAQVAASLAAPAAIGLPYLRPLHDLVQAQAVRVDQLAQRHPPTSRAHFEKLYTAYMDFRRDFSRLWSTWETLQRMADVR